MPRIGKISRNAPLGRRLYGQRLGTKLARNPSDTILVLLAIKSTGAVHQQSAGAQRLPNIAQNLALTLGTLHHRGHAPLLDGKSILAEHSLARTGCIHHNYIKEITQGRKVGRHIARYHRRGVAPFYHILGKHLCAQRHRLVRHQQTALGQQRQQMSTLSAGSGTKVEHTHGCIDILSDGLFEEHRRGLLHVVTTRVKKRVGGKCRAHTQIASIGSPPDGATRKRLPALSPVVTYADNGVGPESRLKSLEPLLAEEGLCAHYKIPTPAPWNASPPSA